jgi:hypothetical protein
VSNEDVLRDPHAAAAYVLCEMTGQS